MAKGRHRMQMDGVSYLLPSCQVVMSTGGSSMELLLGGGAFGQNHILV